MHTHIFKKFEEKASIDVEFFSFKCRKDRRCILYASLNDLFMGGAGCLSLSAA